MQGNCDKLNPDSLHLNYNYITLILVVHNAVKDVSETSTRFCALSQITVRNYSNKHITIRLIKGKREKKCHIKASECVFIYEAEPGACTLCAPL